MRFMLMAAMPTEKGNTSIKEGKLGPTMQSILADIKPEAVYFTAMDGKRTAMVVVDVKEPSDIPRLAEPFFVAFGACVDFYPLMSPEDLGKAMPHIEAAVKKYA